MLLGAAPSWEHRVPFDYGPTKKKKKRKTKLLFRRYSTVNPSVTPQKHASPLTKERLSFLHPAHTMGDDRVCYLDALPDRIRLIAEESPAEVGSCIVLESDEPYSCTHRKCCRTSTAQTADSRYDGRTRIRGVSKSPMMLYTIGKF